MAIRSKDQARHALRHAGDQSFTTQNLETISSLKEFSERLADMRDDVYAYHVGDGYNHFSSWVSNVFGDDKLARDISEASREESAKIVKERVEWLEDKAK